jgi:copper chaperone
VADRTVTVTISGMHCAACSLLVDDCMEDVDGVRTSRTDLRSGQCVAVVDEGVDDAAILAAVVEAGYTGVIQPA